MGDSEDYKRTLHEIAHAMTMQTAADGWRLYDKIDSPDISIEEAKKRLYEETSKSLYGRMTNELFNDPKIFE